MPSIRQAALAAPLVRLQGESAFAHVTLETEKAPPDSTYKAVLRVGHGCEGKPTTAVRVRIPGSEQAAKTTQLLLEYEPAMLVNTGTPASAEGADRLAAKVMGKMVDEAVETARTRRKHELA